jgi:hypothetical protein
MCVFESRYHGAALEKVRHKNQATGPVNFFGRLFSPKKVKIAAKKGNVMVKNDQMVTVLN